MCMYPFHEFEVSAGTLRYWDEGQGPVVVFVHGNPSSSFEFRHVVAELSKTHRCIVPEHLGFGHSDKPWEWDYLPSSHARNLEALLLALDVRDMTLVFGDWGGPISLDFATRNPDRVAGLVITNTWCWGVANDWYFQAFSGFMGGWLGRFLIRRFNFFVRAVVPAAFGDKKKLTKAILDQYLLPLANPRERKGNWVFPKQIVAAQDWLNGISTRLPLLAEKPIALCWGMKDIAFRPKELARWRTIFPQASVTTLAGCGHFVAEENPVELIQSVRTVTAASSQRNDHVQHESEPTDQNP